jgi:hypothetical protein
LQPRSKAKSYLYALFRKLGKDFNSDLFSDDLDAEEKQVPVSAIGPLDDFFRATNIQSGQTSFWPYIQPEVFSTRAADLAGLGFVLDLKEDRYLAPDTPQLRETLQNRSIGFESRSVLDPAQADPEKLEQLEAVKRWFDDDWKRIEPKLRTSIVEGISVFLALFDDNPKVKRVFCPKKECYDPEKNADNQFGKPLPSFSWLIENGKVCALNFPIGMNPGLAKALGVMMKLDFERATVNRIPEIEAHPEQYFRQVLFLMAVAGMAGGRNRTHEILVVYSAGANQADGVGEVGQAPLDH